MMFGINSVYIWVVLLIIFVAVEATTLDLTAVWFAAGALVSLIFASFGIPVLMQWVVFTVVSALLLITVRPWSKKLLSVKGEKTNADRIVGQCATVIEDIDNDQSKGQIKIYGQEWTARSNDDSKILAGTKVKIVAINGVKAIVENI